MDLLCLTKSTIPYRDIVFSVRERLPRQSIITPPDSSIARYIQSVFDYLPSPRLGRPHMPDEADLLKLVNVVLYAVDTHVALIR